MSVAATILSVPGLCWKRRLVRSPFAGELHRSTRHVLPLAEPSEYRGEAAFRGSGRHVLMSPAQRQLLLGRIIRVIQQNADDLEIVVVRVSVSDFCHPIDEALLQPDLFLCPVVEDVVRLIRPGLAMAVVDHDIRADGYEIGRNTVCVELSGCKGVDHNTLADQLERVCGIQSSARRRAI